MAKKPDNKPSTAFGRLLERKDISPSDAASDLGITRQYIWALAHGKVFPGRHLRKRIDAWAKTKGGRVAPSSWDDVEEANV